MVVVVVVVVAVALVIVLVVVVVVVVAVVAVTVTVAEVVVVVVVVEVLVVTVHEHVSYCGQYKCCSMYSCLETIEIMGVAMKSKENLGTGGVTYLLQKYLWTKLFSIDLMNMRC